MPTSVHIPAPLLEALDRRARGLGVSRNRLIVRALERELAPKGGWSEGFFEQLGRIEPGDAAAVDEMLEAVLSRRTRRRARRL
jgi:predicted transcriptional regulator